MSRENVATYRIAGLAICSFLLFGCGGGYDSNTATPPLIGDASLASLTVIGVTLDPVFNPSVFSYTATVPNGTTSVDIAATTLDSAASFTVNGGSNTNVPLVVGDNTISIVVTGQYGSASSAYTIVITRAPFVVDTTVGWDGVENIFNFGKGTSTPNGVFAGIEVFGQTFIVTAGAPILRRLSFWLRHDSASSQTSDDVFFTIVVMAWNTDRASGPVLYESAVQSITTAQSTMTEYMVDTGGLTLVPGQEYIAFLSAINGFWNTTVTLVSVGWQDADIYSQGESWTLNADNDFSQVTFAPWFNPSGPADFVVMFVFD